MQGLLKGTEMLLTEEKKLNVKICQGSDACEIVCGLISKIEELGRENEHYRKIIEIATEEFEKKNGYIIELEKEQQGLKEYISGLEKENKLLKENLEKEQGNVRLFQKMLFSRGSEQQVEQRSDSEKQEEVEYEETESGYVVKTTKRGAKSGHKGHGRKMHDNLPLKEEIIDLPQDKKCCEICGKPLEDTGLCEESSEISVEKTYYRIVKKRKIYKKTCNCNKRHIFVKAPLPPKLIGKGKFSIEFWIELLINKYMNHLPVTRQISDMKSYGIEVSSGTITGGFQFIYSNYIIILYNALIIELRKTKRLHADETGYYIFQEIEGKKNHKWYVWGFVCKNVRVFVLDATRSAKVLYQTLFNMTPDDIEKLTKNKPVDANNSKPLYIVNADKYSAYKALQNQGLILIAYCWAHQKREFEDALTKYPQDQELKLWCEIWRTKISLLYDVNDERIKHTKGSQDFNQYHNKLSDILDWMEKEIEKQYTHPAQIEIMNSMKQHWSGLTLFVQHPEIPMDNNPCERALRPIVLGINNYWGNCSIWGGQLLAAMHSIIQTCLLHGISPRSYLSYYFEECSKRNSAPNENEIELFLPHKLSEKIKQKLKIPEKEVPDDT